MMADATDRRWTVCLHEAGHGIAGLHLLNVRVVAVVIGTGNGASGLCSCGVDGTPRTFAEAVVWAAGEAGGRLAWSTSAPTLEATTAKPIEHIEAKYPETIKGLSQDINRSPTDSEMLARWAVSGPSGGSDWRDVKQRIITPRWAARQFVHEHRIEIEAVARRLYFDGLTVIEQKESER